MSSIDPSSLRAALSRARAQARAAMSSVLDELMAQHGPSVVEGLSTLTGVEVLSSCDAVASVLAHVAPLAASAPAASLHVKLLDGRELALMSDPWEEAEVSRITSRLGRYVEPAACTTELLRALGSAHESPQDEPKSAAKSIIKAVATDGDYSDSGVVAFVDRTIESAFREGASDLHFECDRGGVTAKLRLDGVMSPLARLAGRQQAEEVISRIKVLAQLDITERRLPQDGRFRHGGSSQGLDLRVSIMPSVFGEDAVLRLLDKSHLRSSNDDVTLDALGFDAHQAKRIRLLSNLPNGMLLVTGPTGSGKTTTVYAALSEINTGLEKIITIEDPVEYELPGVLQIPVNERKGLTFAKGLRSILRHDPDRILVGEIRDAETAEIAVQSALTGHLVFTTVHANSLFDVIGRFRHFGIDMFGFVSSLNGVVVQRLMRRLCPVCRGTRAPSSDERLWLDARGAADVVALPAAIGCSECHQTGYRGRFVIAEVHLVSDRFRDLIMSHADVTELKQAAFGDDMPPLVQQALGKVRESYTTLEELFRVVGQI